MAKTGQWYHGGMAKPVQLDVDTGSDTASVKTEGSPPFEKKPMMPDGMPMGAGMTPTGTPTEGMPPHHPGDKPPMQRAGSKELRRQFSMSEMGRREARERASEPEPRGRSRERDRSRPGNDRSSSQPHGDDRMLDMDRDNYGYPDAQRHMDPYSSGMHGEPMQPGFEGQFNDSRERFRDDPLRHDGRHPDERRNDMHAPDPRLERDRDLREGRGLPGQDLSVEHRPRREPSPHRGEDRRDPHGRDPRDRFGNREDERRERRDESRNRYVMCCYTWEYDYWPSPCWCHEWIQLLISFVKFVFIKSTIQS